MAIKKNNPGCNCCELSPPCPCYPIYLTISGDGVPYSGYYPTVFNLSVSGLTDDNCGSCDTWNGDFELCWNTSTGDWRSPPSSSTDCGHSNGDPLYKLTVSPGGIPWVLTALGIDYSWSLLPQYFEPFGSNDLALGIPPSPNPCNNVPDPVTITACLTECTGCSTKEPTVSVTLSGWPDFECDCSDVNDTFILQSIPQSYYGHCRWSVLPWVYEGTCQGFETHLTIYAQDRHGLLDNETNVGWIVDVTYDAFLRNWQFDDLPSGYQTVRSRVVYWWDSGGASPFDCSATRTLSVIYEENSGNLRPCGFLSGTSCQIN